jgi:uncharacterized lipoprotein YddW (UPF0748 family)
MNRIYTAATLLVLLVLSSFLGSCESIPKEAKTRTRTRAMWVTRFDYKTRADLETIAENCRSAGVTTILFQVRGNGTAFYRSSYEPWAEQFEFSDPGFDPLAVMVEEGHRRGMQVHAWINVMPAWRGGTPPKELKQLYNAHPEWMWYDQNGKRQELSKDFYVSLNPALPEVRRYFVNVCRDIVGRYGVDGLHLDYIRMPSEAPATPKGSNSDWLRDPKTVGLFEAETGKKPDQDRAAWTQWKADQITNLLRDIRHMVNTTKRNCELSAATGTDPKHHLTNYAQDIDQWMEDRLLDAVYPMNYTDDVAKYSQVCDQWKVIARGTPVVMGMMMGSKDIDNQVARIQRALDVHNGVSYFAYAELFPSAGDGQDAAGKDKAFVRERIRKAMMPKLDELSRSGS